jgi:hypothetical protein
MFDPNSEPNSVLEATPDNWNQNSKPDELFPTTVEQNANSMMSSGYDICDSMSPDCATNMTQHPLVENSVGELNSSNSDRDRLFPPSKDGVNCGVVDSQDELFSDKPGVTILADTNRDGKVNELDQEGKQTWDKNHGAIFLPNLDDDSNKFQDIEVPEGIEGDRQLAKLNDANDSIVNGSEDAKDLAEIKIQPWSDAPDDTKVKLHTDSKSQPYVRMFLKKDGQYTAIENDSTLQLSDLRIRHNLVLKS